MISLSERLNENLVDIKKVYTKSKNHLLINVDKLVKYIDSVGFVIDFDDIHYDNGTGRNDTDPKLGDVCELFFGVSSKSMNGSLSSKDWDNLKKELEKIPHVNYIVFDKNKYKLTIEFDDSVLVEI